MTTYIRDGGSWRPVTEIYIRDGSWRTVNSAWVYTGSGAANGWKQVHSTGTFSPTLRNPTTEALFNNRSVGLPVELYRGSTVSGSYAYKFQYSFTDQVSWTNENATANNNGTLTGTTLTTSFTTDTTYLDALENAAYSGDVGGELDDVDTYRRQDGKFIFIRARVIKSGETQFTNTVRIQKRKPIDTGTIIQLVSGGTTYNLSGAGGVNRSPRPGDTIRWVQSFQNTTSLTNDTRPDYYWFSYDTAGGTTYKNSVISDPGNPRVPTNARTYLVQNNDVGAVLTTNLRAINSNTDTTDFFFATLEVTDGVLKAPENLVLSYVAGQLRCQWDAAVGGDDSLPKNYVVEIERDGVVVHTSASITAIIYNYTTAVSGNYRFRVTVSQSGSASQTSIYSNTYTLSAPSAFGVTIQNITNQNPYLPSAFSINAPTLSSTVLNRWDWTWTTSTITGPAYAKTGSFNVTSINNWDSRLTRPDGTQTSTINVNTPTDWWSVTSSGNHTETVTARNNRKNYVRISWTRPVGTSAASYRVTINAYSASTGGSLDWTRTINVEDINFVDIEHDYNANGNYADGQAVLVTSVTAYSGSGQTGTSTSGTIPPFSQFGADGTTSWSGCNVIGTTVNQRTDSLQLENPVAGTITTTGIFEPGETMSLAEGTGWSPSYSSWTKSSYNWIKSRTIQPTTAGTSSTQVIANNSTAVGSQYFCEVVVSYKGVTDTKYSSFANVVPGPPSYSLTDLLNRTFRISNAVANGGTSFFGTYSGVSSGTISETLIAGGTFTSPTVNTGSISTTVFSRRYVTYVYPSTVNNVQVNSTRSTVNNVTIATPPQSTGSRRYLATAPSVGAGNIMYISTNGYFGNATMPTNNYLTGTLPSPGAFLNIAAQDLVLVYCYTKVDNGGTWIRYRGYRYNTPGGPFLEYQAYLTFAGEAYVLFIENGLTDYRVDLAYFTSGTQQSTWSGNSSQDTSSFTLNQGTSGWTQRTQTSGSADDGVISFTVIRPARQHQASAVTRTAGGFTFNITNVDDSLFESAATYGVSTTAGSASINASTGLVTQTGLTSSQFATVTVSKTRTGYENATNVDRQGQALAGAAPVQTAAPTISASGSTDGSGTVRRVQVGGTVSGSAGTYSNQSSISSGLLTILSNSYTGADSNWTSTTPFATSTSIANTAASASANMYRWRDRVVGTDGSTVDFYTSVIYRAVYAPPPGGLSTPQQTSIGINYTGGSGPQRYYRYQNGVELNFITDSGSGPFFTNFTGLTPDTPYTIQLFGGNTEGYLSVTAVGGATRTAAAASLLATPSPSASTNRTDGILISWSPIANAAFYGVWYRGAAPSYDTVPDFGGVANPSLITGSSYLDTSMGSGVTRQYDVQAYPAVGSTTFLKSQYGGPATGTRATTPPPTAPLITSGPSITWSSGNNFTLSATASNATNLEFFVEFANNNGGPALRTQTFFFPASSGGGQTGAQANSWARTQVRANNTTTGLSSSFSGFTGWA